MNIKMLETKLQTIFEDDLFVINKKDALDKIERELIPILITIAEFNNAVGNLYDIENSYEDKFEREGTALIFKKRCEEIEELLEDETYKERMKYVDFLEEILVNQDLFDIVKVKIPSLVKLADKLNRDNCYKLYEIREVWEQNLISLRINDFANGSVYEFLNDEFMALYELLVPYNQNIFVKNEKVGEANEGTGSN